MKHAAITGITGQDGSYLAELLLAKGYVVHGLIRRASTPSTSRIDHLRVEPQAESSFRLHYGDVLDGASLRRFLEAAAPDEVYHLAAQSHVRVSFDMPEYTCETTALGTLRVLEAVRDVCPQARVYHAASSEIFGNASPPQHEGTPIQPRSPYGAAKAFAYHLVQNYRESYGLFAVNGILFNHESERRAETFVTRKITRAVGRIVYGLQDKLYLGNVSARRDWTYAPEAVAMMWRMLQADAPDDYVIGAGTSHTVLEAVQVAFAHAHLNLDRYLAHDPRYLRPTEVDHLCADPAKAVRTLGWSPAVGFEAMIARMVDHDMLLAHREFAARR